MKPGEKTDARAACLCRAASSNALVWIIAIKRPVCGFFQMLPLECLDLDQSSVSILSFSVGSDMNFTLLLSIPV